ncbi:hypothetical protein GCM10009623_14610 [Nocardioides aestuarii]|uniref:Choice-of-anchor P family protein n=1 Tax=Nocardioides aestuarii TaxID=252231 RepID=A0ABW4TL26_9ACTN
MALALTLPVALTGAGALAAPAGAAPAGADRAGAKGPTAFAFTSRGFGTRVNGGEVPVESDTTAFQRIGCTNRAGIVKRISEADVDVPGLGTVSGISTVLRTTKSRNGTRATTAVQRVASVDLVDTPLGSLSIQGLRAKARAFHNGSGFHATATTEVGKIVLTPAVGDPQEFELPSADQPLEIPGLATISVGPRSSTARAGGSSAQATTLIIDVVPSDTRAIVGLARARMKPGVQDLLFRGSSSGIRAKALDGLLTKKRTPLTLMPCQGTGGKTQTKDIAGVDLTDAIVLGALSSGQRTWKKGKVTRAWERGRVAGLDLGDGELVIEAVQAKANLIKRKGHKTRFNAKGTTVGRVFFNGDRQEFPDTGPLEIPGLATIEPRVTKRTKQTFEVVGLRVTLLEGTGGVIDLGTAKIGGKRSGR